MRDFRWLSISLLLLVSCTKPLPEIQSFDAAQWKNDRNGCKGERVQYLHTLDTERDKLLELNEMQVIELLGRPDQNEIYKRNQKFYTYFIQPAVSCDNDSLRAPKKLIVRFTAMGISNQVVIE